MPSRLVADRTEQLRNTRASRGQSRKILRRLALEHLEERCLLSTVTWDGGGDGSNWNDPQNWNKPDAVIHDVLPGAEDDVVIGMPGTVTVSGLKLMNSLDVGPGVVITHAVGDVGGVNLEVAGLVSVAGAIDVTANGYRGGRNSGNFSGAGETPGGDGAVGSGGGSYGSLGGGSTNALYGDEQAPAE